MRGTTIKTKTLKREKTCFCVKQLVQRHYGGSSGQKRQSGMGSPQHKHTKSTSLSLSLGKTPRHTLHRSPPPAPRFPSLRYHLLHLLCALFCSSSHSAVFISVLRSVHTPPTPPPWPQTGQTTASIRGVCT